MTPTNEIPTNEALLEEFKDKISNIRAGSTLDKQTTVIKNYLKFINNEKKHLFDIKEKDIDKWLKEEKSKNKFSTKSKTTGIVKVFYDFLIKRKYVAENPFAEISQEMRRQAKKRRTSRPILTVADVTKIIRATTDPRERAILLTLYKTGMRRGELVQLDLENISWDERRIDIPIRKGGSSGYVYFDDECARTLRIWISVRVAKENGKEIEKALFTGIRGERIAQTTVGMIVKKNGIKSGVGKDTIDTSKAITPHVFRYAFTTHLAGNRCHPKVIQMLRGDADRTMLDRYTQFTPEQVKGEYLRTIPKLGL
ncbi:MAG: tyrosine-type recombinase/integrase [Candidatus Methanoperedens sp.]